MDKRADRPESIVKGMGSSVQKTRGNTGADSDTEPTERARPDSSLSSSSSSRMSRSKKGRLEERRGRSVAQDQKPGDTLLATTLGTVMGSAARVQRSHGPPQGAR